MLIVFIPKSRIILIINDSLLLLEDASFLSENTWGGVFIKNVVNTL